MTCGVYKIINKVNGHVYVGSSVNIERRHTQHFYLLGVGRHHSRYLQAAWNKYGKNQFSFELIIECFEYELEIQEQVYIDKLHPVYNVNPCAGLTRERRHTEESRKRMSQARKGWHPSLFLIDMVRNRMMGNTYRQGMLHSKESKQKMSEATRGERNGNAKLTEQDISEIRCLLDTHSYRELAIMFSVSKSTIGWIAKGQHWK